MAALLMSAVMPPSVRAAPQPGGWTANDDDALLLDVRLGKYRLGDGVRGYVTPEGACVDLADTVMALDLPIRIDRKAGRVTGWAFAEAQTIVVDRAARTEQIMNDRRDLDSAAVRDTPEGWCVDTRALARWLGVSLIPDLSNAILKVESETKLPLELQMERRARAASMRPAATFDLKSLPQASAPYRAWRTPSVDVVASIGGLSDRRGGMRELNASYELFATGEIARTSVEARLASDRKGRPASLRMRAYRTDPEGKLPLGATTIAAGDVTAMASPIVSSGAIGRGALISNRPVDRPDTFDRTSFRGELPAGWDAELYRNGQLLAFARDRSDGRYEFLQVPLLYGQNRFEIVLYGPQGQVRRDYRTVPVGLDSIPPGKTWFWAGAVDENRDLVSLDADPFNAERFGWRGAFGLERGLDAKTAIAGSVQSLVIEGNRFNYLEASLRRAIGPSLAELTLSGSDSGGRAARLAVLGEFGRTYLTAESILARDFGSDRVDPGVTGLHSLSLDHSFTLGRTILPVHVEGRYVTRASGVSTFDLGARVSTTVRGISVTALVDRQRQIVRHGLSPPDRTEAALLFNGRAGRMRLRGELRYRLSPESRFESANLIGEWGGGGDADWRAELGYDASLSRGRAGVGYIRNFNHFALTASAEAATDGSLAAGLNLAFSLGPDPAGSGIRVTHRKLAAQGQALVRVYRDANGDGVRQAGEPLEKNVQLAAGRVPVDSLTDAGGRAIVDGLQPFEPVLIGVDASSLADPMVQPATPGMVVTPRPGVAIAVDLPLVAAGEIDGTLVKAGGGAIQGIDLELVDMEGRVVRVTRSEFDGFFLFEGVPYGGYLVRIAALSAEAARLTPVIGARASVGAKTPSVHLGAVAADPLVRTASN
ncbi:carboxypeptidase regulatory-like domain-containing protein [Sphingomonas gilva]|uniref:Carboxypeptidase regulatory-like domain-containing protein n=1 Tax=Sphingomonas gilva TaxID=2305907 RepID=A0A396S2N4_9SPHN|nr:carboxypeptidase regulatory-like domain-containing protein [Sphingomonas gilva]